MFPINMVELVAEDQHQSPCKHGNIVGGHACYCHAPTDNTPRKCHIWRQWGEQDKSKWITGECLYFEQADVEVA